MEEQNPPNKENEIIESIKEVTVPPRSQLPFELLHGQDRKTTKLVANSGSTVPMGGSNRWYDYSFKEPVFLSEVIVDEENYNSFNEFEFKWKLEQGGEVHQGFSKSGPNTYRAAINQLVREVSFKPPKKWFSDTKITRVQLVGFRANELEAFVRLVSRLDQYKSDIITSAAQALGQAERADERVVELKGQLRDIETEIAAEVDRANNLQSSIGRATEERKTLMEDIAKREEAISALDDRRSRIQETVAERTAVREKLAADITEARQTLRTLEDDVNLFPTEISAFVSQGAQNIRTYWKMAVVPIFLLVLVTGLLVFNAANLTTVLEKNEQVSILSILVTRVPYVVITSAIIAASYKLAKILIAEIMRINQQRLNLSKISIIATDVSNSSQEGLGNLTDQEIYTLRTDLKMQLLRDHLKDYLSEDFKYQGKQTRLRSNEPEIDELEEDTSEIETSEQTEEE